MAKIICFLPDIALTYAFGYDTMAETDAVMLDIFYII